MDPTPSEMPAGSPPPPAPAPPPQAPAPPPQAPAPAPQASAPPLTSTQPAWMASMTSTAPVAGPAGFFYADIPNRAIAYIIDAIILFVGFLIVAAVLTAVGLRTVNLDFGPNFGQYNPIAGLIYGVANLAISVAYFVYTWTAMRGTVGMKALGMQIGNAQDGKTITMDQALRRALILFGVGAVAQALGGWPGLGILFSLAAFAWFIYLLYTTAVSPTKQGFHDKFANTMVVKAARSVG